jgi:hypothetical protein
MASENNSIPLACTLSADQLPQRQQVIQALFQRLIETRELDQGFEFIFPGEEQMISELADFIRFERNCCRFLSFELRFEPEQGPLHLRILGTQEAKPIIREIFRLEQ